MHTAAVQQLPVQCCCDQSGKLRDRQLLLAVSRFQPAYRLCPGRLWLRTYRGSRRIRLLLRSHLRQYLWQREIQSTADVEHDDLDRRLYGRYRSGNGEHDAVVHIDEYRSESKEPGNAALQP